MGDKDTARWTLQRRQWNMRRRTASMLSFLDTAGRLHVDEDMMQELQEIKEAVVRRSDTYLS